MQAMDKHLHQQNAGYVTDGRRLENFCGCLTEIGIKSDMLPSLN
jgi:hypothetical protein